METMKRSFIFLPLLLMAFLVLSSRVSNLHAQNPSLSVNPNELTFGEIEIGEEAVLSYSLTGENLISNIMINATPAFLISLDEDSGFQNHLVLEPVDGAVSQTVYVKFLPMQPRPFHGRVRNMAMGVQNQMVFLHGIGILDFEDIPQLTMSADTLSFGEIPVGEEAVLSYNLSGTDLIGNVIFHSNPGYLISLNENEGFQPHMVIEPVNGEIQETIYVKFIPMMPRPYPGRVRHRTIGLPPQFVYLQGTGTIDDLYPPVLTITPDSLFFGAVQIGEEALLSYTLTGENLLSPVHIRSTRGYLLSLDDQGDFVPVIFLEPTDGTIVQTVYVKFLPLQVRDYTGILRHRSAGIFMEPLFVSGTGIETDRSSGVNLPDDLIAVSLLDNYPNPFNPETTIGFTLSSEGFVILEVFNIKGQKIVTLVNDFLSAGHHRVVWNGRDESNRNVASGIYFYRIKKGTYTSTRKMILMK